MALFSATSLQYERLLVEAGGDAALLHCLGAAMRLGEPVVSAAGSAHAKATPDQEERSARTNALLLKKCQSVVDHLRRTCATADDGTDAATDPAQRFVERAAAYSAVLAELIHAPHPPATKLDIAADIAARMLREGVVGDAAWEAVQLCCVVWRAAAVLLHGPDSVPAAHGSLDVAVTYLLLGNPVSALEHTAAASLSLRNLQGDGHGEIGHLRAKLLLAEATAHVMAGTFDVAHTRAKAALAAATALYGQSDLRAYALVAEQAAAATHADHQGLLDLCDAAIAGSAAELVDPLWALLPLLRLHIDLLQRADERLRAPAVAAVRRRLLAAVGQAATRAELDDVQRRLEQDAATLRGEADDLRLCAVRQGEHIHALGTRWVESACRRIVRGDASTSGAGAAAALVAFVAARSATVCGRGDDAVGLADAAAALFDATVGAAHPMAVQARLLAGTSCAYQSSMTASASRGVVTSLRAATSPTVASAEAVLQTLDGRVDHTPQRRIVALESVLGALLSADSKVAQDYAALLPCVAALHALYDGQLMVQPAQALLAAWTAALAGLLGPHHPATVAKLAAWTESCNTVFRPVFRPSGGVVPLGTIVQIASPCADADIFVSTCGDLPVPEEGVNSSRLVSGSVVLDRVGAHVLRAVAIRDGKRSAATDARFFVTAAS